MSGTVRDAQNGEDMIGATVYLKEKPSVGAISNEYGFYSITTDPGAYTIVYRFASYNPVEKTVDLQENQKIDVELGSKELETVEITAERDDENIRSNEMSVTKLSPKEVEAIPVLLGEKDIVKTLQLTPGVKPAGEGSSGFYVRGGGADQNLILLDEAPVYNASHLLGFFSVFNSDALKDVTLYKGGMPAEYGGRASSVMDIRMKDGNKKRFGISGGIGLIASRLTLEAPIVKDKGSFIISGRRTYADLFLRLSQDSTINQSILYFYDLNLKANYQIGEKDRVFLSGYFGRDKFGFGETFGFDWGNTTGTLRWNHLFSDKVFSNTTFIYSDYDYRFDVGTDESGFGLRSRIRDFNFKEDITWFAGEKHTFKFGANAIYHDFLPGEATVRASGNEVVTSAGDRYALEAGFYAQDDIKVSSRFGMNLGIRYSLFNNLGPGSAYTFDDQGNLLSETTYDDWES
ncbi:MAG: TonB-dependent receptor, partial [Bacteroidota bacterium]